jgi:hypothetical protein
MPCGKMKMNVKYANWSKCPVPEGWRGFAASAHWTRRKTMTKGYEGIKTMSYKTN